MREEELLSELDLSIDAMHSAFSADILNDYDDIIAMRVARSVADWYMYAPEFQMTDSFRDAVVERLAQGHT